MWTPLYYYYNEGLKEYMISDVCVVMYHGLLAFVLLVIIPYSPRLCQCGHVHCLTP